MTRYTILTEWKDNVPAICANWFTGFSIVRQIGYYESTKEESCQIIILGQVEDDTRVNNLAKVLGETNNQSEVWVTAEFVTLEKVQIKQEQIL